MRWIVNDKLIFKISYKNHLVGCFKTCLPKVARIPNWEGILAGSSLPLLPYLFATTMQKERNPTKIISRGGGWGAWLTASVLFRQECSGMACVPENRNRYFVFLLEGWVSQQPREIHVLREQSHWLKEGPKECNGWFVGPNGLKWSSQSVKPRNLKIGWGFTRCCSTYLHGNLSSLKVQFSLPLDHAFS